MKIVVLSVSENCLQLLTTVEMFTFNKGAMQCTIFAGSSFKVPVIDAIFYVWDLQCRYTNNVVQIL